MAPDEERGTTSSPGAHQTVPGMVALLDAVVAVGSDLELPEVLRRIVRSACTLVGARYGALGVLRPDGSSLAELVTHGLSEGERCAVGELPHGRGVLGLLIREPRAQRLREISEHPRSCGFPPDHPPMHSFLGVPVRVREEVFGNLYLTEKQGAEEFTAEDEELLQALASAAGAAIANARLYATVQDQRAWSDAVVRLTRTLLASLELQPALDQIATLALERTGATVTFVLLWDEEGGLVVRARHPDAPRTGGDRSVHVGTRVLAGCWQEVPEAVVRVPGGAPGHDAVAQEVCRLAGSAGTDGFAVLPLGSGEHDIGFLVVVWPDGTGPSGAVRSLLDFSQHAGMALLAARSQRDQALLALLEDHDRIARDMHDHVIQRLFATGLSLQSAARLAVHPTVRERLDDAVDDLDGAIREIRHTIYELHRLPAGSIRDEISGLVGDASDLLGFEPSLLVEGRLSGLTDTLAQDLVAVVRESLANVVRHARAASVSVHVRCDDHVRVVVTDDGVGTDGGAARSGLVNLRARATARGGSLEVVPGTPSGTVVRWAVPAERDD